MKLLYIQSLTNTIRDMLNGLSLLPALLRYPTPLLAGLPLEEGKYLCQHGPRPLLPLRLCQCGLCLGQPEGNVHGAVHLDSRRQRATGLLPLTGRGVQGAQAAVAVGLERAHAEFGGQGEGLLVVGGGLRGIRGVGVGMDGAELAERFRLEPALPELPAQGERLVHVLHGLITAACQETDRAEPRDIAGLSMQRAAAATFPERLLQERAPLGEATHECISIAKARRGPFACIPVVSGATEG